jgi:hypothetical protein
MRRRELLRDQPEPPLARAVWWIEYMARHQGADHLRPASRDLAWFQVYLLDVWAFIILLVSVVMLTLRMLFRLCCGRSKQGATAAGHAKKKSEQVKNGTVAKKQTSKNAGARSDNGHTSDNGAGKKQRFVKQD